MSVPAESVFFDLWSASYDRPGLQATTYRPVHDAVLERLEDRSIDAVLDLGCGTGHLTGRLCERFPDATVVGVDLSNGMLDRARQRDETSLLVRADAQQLPLPDASLDAVVCTESFHWYHDQQAAALEMARLLRPGGRLIIASVAAVTHLGDDAIQRATTAAGRPLKALSKRRLRHLLDHSGFTVEHQGRIPRLGFVPWPVLTDAVRD